MFVFNYLLKNWFDVWYLYYNKKKKILWTPAIVASHEKLIELILVGVRRAYLWAGESGKQQEEKERERNIYTMEPKRRPNDTWH